MPIAAYPQNREQLLAAWQMSPEEQKLNLYEAMQRRCCLLILQGWMDVHPHPAHTAEQKLRFLLAYKVLEWIWFADLPQSNEKVFNVFVREDNPELEELADISDAFEMSTDELEILSEKTEKPRWITRKTKRVLVSLRSFPYQEK